MNNNINFGLKFTLNFDIKIKQKIARINARDVGRVKIIKIINKVIKK